MKITPNEQKGVPFEEFCMEVMSLRAPIALAEGTANGTAVKLPTLSKICVIQKTGAIVSSGSLAGTIEQSATGSGSWSTIGTFTAAGAADIQKIYVTPTELYIRHVAVVTGSGGTGTIVTDVILLQ